MPPWVRDYIGIPWRERGRDRGGLDCWGLYRLLVAEQFRVSLPSLEDGYATTADREAIEALVRGEQAGPWREVPQRAARAGDALLLRIAGWPWHVAVVVAPPAFLHAMPGAGVVLEDWTRRAWEHRVLGVWRHRALEGAACPAS